MLGGWSSTPVTMSELSTRIGPGAPGLRSTCHVAALGLDVPTLLREIMLTVNVAESHGTAVSHMRCASVDATNENVFGSGSTPGAAVARDAPPAWLSPTTLHIPLLATTLRVTS